MKFSLLFIFLFLFSTGCGLFKDKKNTDSEETKKIKIHRKNEFTPECYQNAISNKVTCGLGQAVCGIEFKNSDIKVYCVDADNTILATALCCEEYDDACKKRTTDPIVIQGILSPVPNCSPPGPKIQKNSAFIPKCRNNESINCVSGSPACGTKPGSGDLTAYCIDEDDTILGYAFCSGGLIDCAPK